MYFCRQESYKNKTRELDESEATGNQRYKDSVFSCYNQVNGRFFMEYLEFERILSAKRMQRYKDAANGDTRKAMALYRYNLRLSQEMFTIVSCFEVALRNAIDSLLVPTLGENWLKDSVQDNGIFSNGRMNETRKIIEKAYNRLNRQGIYSHSKLIAEMEFGVWKYMYSSLQYRVTGQCLLRAFPNKPRSSAAIQYNNTYIFNELDKVNSLRNRIAHHEPICFRLHASEIDTSYIVNEYQKIQTLFSWMGIDSRSMLYGLDHVQSVCSKINALK